MGASQKPKKLRLSAGETSAFNSKNQKPPKLNQLRGLIEKFAVP